MKYHRLFALAAFITGSALGAMPAVMPEFKTDKQLAVWRAEMEAKNSTTTSTSDVRSSKLDVPTAFYTGKPYVESSGGYAFKYRSYSPDLARWTSEDPSGFPDGANNSLYVNNASLNTFDPLGLDNVTVSGTMYNDGSNLSIRSIVDPEHFGSGIQGKSVVA